MKLKAITWIHLGGNEVYAPGETFTTSKEEAERFLSLQCVEALDDVEEAAIADRDFEGFAEKEADLSSWTVKELKEKLDEMGISYPSNAKKEELVSLLD